VPKTLLAVDDSATMRKVLEITFAGEDFRVVSADGASNALARLSDDPVAAVIDMSLGGDDGYALAKEIRARNGRVAVVLMASRFSPYDANRGRDAGVDDFIDKPFDTQSLIDKVKKALVAREASRAAAPPAPLPSTTVPLHTAPSIGTAPRPPFVAPTAPKPALQTQRTHTLSFEGGASPPAAPAPAPRPAVSAVTTAPARPAPQASATLPPPMPVGLTVPVESARPAGAISAAAGMAAANGRLTGQLDELGLTAEQVHAVLALSRELVERVVWEVVPQLAEAMIKEEILRLTKES
jgi:DNA-binding response OmpR family regulator